LHPRGLAQRHRPPDVEPLADQYGPVHAEDLLRADAGVPGVEAGVVADDAPAGDAVPGQVGAHGVRLVVVLAAVVAGDEDDLDAGTLGAAPPPRSGVWRGTARAHRPTGPRRRRPPRRRAARPPPCAAGRPSRRTARWRAAAPARTRPSRPAPGAAGRCGSAA